MPPPASGARTSLSRGVGTSLAIAVIVEAMECAVPAHHGSKTTIRSSILSGEKREEALPGKVFPRFRGKTFPATGK